MTVAVKNQIRQERAVKQAADYRVFPAAGEGDTWYVAKADGTHYLVDLAGNTCDCPDSIKRAPYGVVCKHIHIARTHAESLPAEVSARHTCGCCSSASTTVAAAPALIREIETTACAFHAAGPRIDSVEFAMQEWKREQEAAARRARALRDRELL